MKIGILTERMKRGFGVDLVVDEQARGLVAQGFDVTVVVQHADRDWSSQGYRLIVIDRLGLGPLDYHSEDSMKIILSAAALNDVDVWILQTPPFYDWAKFLDRPVVVVEHGTPPLSFFSPEIARQIDQLAQDRLVNVYGGLQPFDAIVSISHSIHDWLPSYAKPFSTVIHHGADHYGDTSKLDANDLRASIGIGEGDCMVLWVGRMQIENDEQPYKGFRELLSLMPLINRHASNVKFVLLGRISDEDKKVLEKDGLIILPNYKSKDMGAAYAASDLLINLSQWEGFNLALLEAQYQGTPVIAYDLGPHPEIVRQNETGILAPTPQEFFQAIIRLCENPTLRKQFGANARSFAHTFTWRQCVIKLAEVVTACHERGLGAKDIGALRKEAAKRLRDEQMAVARRGREFNARQILALDGLDFTKAASLALLDRLPDSAEEIEYLRRLRKGASKSTVLKTIADSPEARERGRVISGLNLVLAPVRVRGGVQRLGRWMTATVRFFSPPRRSVWLQYSDAEFVKNIYRTLLGREVEPGALEYWSGRLRGGESRQNIISTVRYSPEGRARPLKSPELKRILLLPSMARSPLLKWIVFLRSPKRSIWLQYLDADFVRNAYQTLLGREVESGGVEYWSGRLQRGESRQAILSIIRFSPEGIVRPLKDPVLLRILFITYLARSSLLGWASNLLRPGTVPAEALKRIAVESDTNAIAANQEQLARIEAGVTVLQRMIEHQRERLDGLGDVSAATIKPDGRPQFLSSSESRWPADFVPAAAVFARQPEILNLGGTHTALISPGAAVDLAAISRLARHAQVTGSDLIFGDEWEKSPSNRRYLARAAFSHDAFLSRPDLGGMIAVRNELLAEARLGIGAALTGPALLRLVSRAHSITHTSMALCERFSQDVETNLPGVADMRAYIDDLGRAATLASGPSHEFDVRFPTFTFWKAAVVIVEGEDTQATTLTLDAIKAYTPPERIHLTVVRSSVAKPRQRARASTAGSPEIITLPPGTRHAAMANAAVATAPHDCNLLVILQAGVCATASDWLERLAETALFSDTGVVAPMTLYPDGRLRHAGLTPDPGGAFSYVYRFSMRGGEEITANKPAQPLRGMREVMAAGGHCLVLRRSVFETQNAFDESLGNDTYDIDFCLRLRAVQLKILLDSRVVMTQADPTPRWARSPNFADVEALRSRYAVVLGAKDPFWASEPVRDQHMETRWIPPMENR